MQLTIFILKFYYSSAKLTDGHYITNWQSNMSSAHVTSSHSITTVTNH